MGKFITVPAKLIKPTQTDLSYQGLEFILEIYHSFASQLLPPIPVRYHLGEYLLLDGHHRTAVEVFLGREKVPVYLAKSAEDWLDESLFPFEMRKGLRDNNGNIYERFKLVLKGRNYAKEYQCQTIRDLFGFDSLYHLAKKIK